MRLLRCSLAAVAAAALAAPVAGGAGAIRRISTVAGNGVAGYSGDAALTPLLSEPRGLAVLPDGSFLVAEAFANAVVRVYPDGSIATVAGNNEPGYGGDGGPATAAQLSQPHELALTPDGGFLIADALNNCIRKVAADGTITTVAGTGSVGSFGDG